MHVEDLENKVEILEMENKKLERITKGANTDLLEQINWEK